MTQGLQARKLGKRRSAKRYRLTQDIVIPAGTILGEAPSRTVRFTNHVDTDLAHGPDRTSTWTMDTDDAIDAGLIEEVKED